MKFLRVLPFLVLVSLALVFVRVRPVEASCRSSVGDIGICLAQEPSRPSATETPSDGSQSGNDTLKLASLGVVFLLIGAAVVYAPQIVGAISGFPRRVTGKPRKAAPAKPAAKVPAPRTEEVRLPPPIERPLPPPVAPVMLDNPVRVSEPDDVVTRLQSEVRSAWSRTR